MDQPYSEFARYVLRDLCVRAEVSFGNVIFTGNHMSRQFAKPVRSETESAELFETRCKKWKKRIPRASDFSYRLALATEALRRSGNIDYASASIILGILRDSQDLSATVRTEYAARGICYQRIAFPPGSTRRGNRIKPKKSEILDVALAESLRTQASRFKKEHPEFAVKFENEFHGFCESYSEVRSLELHNSVQFDMTNLPDDWIEVTPRRN